MTVDRSLNLVAPEDWFPASCTLPTAEQPLRRREFDELFAHDVSSVQVESPGRTRFELRADPEVAARAAALALKESGCCSFFTFDLAIAAGGASLVVSTAPSHEDVLAALRARAEAQMDVGA